MGLRLYQAPVESDIQSKPAAEKSSAESRSTIRRHRLVRGYHSARDQARDQVRERRRRVFEDAIWEPRRSPTLEPPPVPVVHIATAVSNPHRRRILDESPWDAPEQPRRRSPDLDAPTDPATRYGGRRLHYLPPDERIAAMFGGRWAPQLYAGSNPSQTQTEDDNSPVSAPPADSPTATREPFFIPRERYLSHIEPLPMVSSLRSTQAPNHPSHSFTTSLASVPTFLRPTSASRGENQAFGYDSSESFAAGRRWAESRRRNNAQRSALAPTSGVDGLGDRTRSLSPEGGDAWETLLTTIAPDPQPPSVGSSFASATASAAATQSTVAASSRTSFTNPETIDVEPASGCDNSDTDEDELEEDIRNYLLPRARSTGQSWADVAGRSGSSSDDPSVFGGVEAIQRLVRNLAQREDIPDDWWAEVGLSRTLSREASA
ncbi:hypothetical protein QBC40DRAFT_26852 [Triangularia verruculosa]|uniref:Uncharacterized protein n=1 Tax=Triangularia verruculosa TaxID=2587418 RepID=A0AAN6XM73_9PEZI|nr:hypothetical protein QBC40DRAFT_26852 [Triangularia verruculosa]